MRAHEVAALAVLAATGLMVAQAAWTPPQLTPSEAHERIGERVRVEGMAIDVIHFNDGAGRFVLAADGGAVHARFRADVAIHEDAWIIAEGTLRKDAGLPLLEVDRAWMSNIPTAAATPLALLAQEPAQFIDEATTLQGTVIGNSLADDGVRLRLAGEVPEDGKHQLTGVLRHDAACVCHVFHVAQSLPWTPSSR